MSTPYCLASISVGGDIDKYRLIFPCREATDCLYSQLMMYYCLHEKYAVGPAVPADDDRDMTKARKCIPPLMSIRIQSISF